MKLINFNYAQDKKTVLSASSSSLNFPVANIKNEFRAKEWRSDSNGTFKIPADKNKITLDSTEYEIELDALETAETLVSKINSEIMGDDFEIVFNEEDGFWTILNTEENDFEIDNYSVDSLLKFLGFNESNYSGEDSYKADVQTIHTEEFVTFDLRTSEFIDTFVVLWGKGLYNLSEEAEMKVQASAYPDFSVVGFEQGLTLDNKGEVAQIHFEKVQFRYWRVVISDPHNLNLYVNIGTVVLGLSNQVLLRTSRGFSFSVKDKSKVYETDFGQSYTDKYPKIKTFGLKFDVLSLEETTELINIFQQSGVSETLFISLDPQERVLNEEFWIYGKIASGLGLRNTSLNIFDSDLTVEERN